jgi:hypothetical protein
MKTLGPKSGWQALSPANSASNDALVGLLLKSIKPEKRVRGDPRGPGGPPHLVLITFGAAQAHGHSLAVAVRPLFPEVLCLSHLLKTLRLSELLPGELRDKFE